jgi:hypothetical protein
VFRKSTNADFAKQIGFECEFNLTTRLNDSLPAKVWLIAQESEPIHSCTFLFAKAEQIYLKTNRHTNIPMSIAILSSRQPIAQPCKMPTLHRLLLLVNATDGSIKSTPVALDN